MEQKVITPIEALEFMRTQFIMNIACVNGDTPISSVLLFYIEDDFTVYFATHKDSYKSQALLSNSKVSMSIWEHNKMLIQADGEATEISDLDEALAVIDKLAESSIKGDEFWPPLLRIKGDSYIVFAIKPIWMRALDLSRDTLTQDDSPFSTIIDSRNE